MQIKATIFWALPYLGQPHIYTELSSQDFLKKKKNNNYHKYIN